MTRHITLSALLIIVVGYCSLNATFAINTVKPYDNYLWTGIQKKGTFQLGFYGANSYNERGVRWDHTKVCNVLQMWNCDQNTLAMVRGFDSDSEIGQRAAELNDVPDNCVRGHVTPSADFHLAEGGIGARYWLPKGFSLGLFLPFIRMQLKNIRWCDCTSDVTEADYLTKDLLTDNLGQNVYELGGLDICTPWKRSGVGDLSFITRWERDFPQPKPILTNVYTSIYLGLSLPTGKRADIDRLFALPFGYDGSPGILFGGALGLTWKHHFIGGVELNMTQLIGDTRRRRIKTAACQTDLLLLAKTQVHIDWGFLQRYRLYLGAHEIMKGLSFDVNYQFQKQGDSTLSICSNDYISSIANTAESLKMWTLHHIGINVQYDFGYDLCEDINCSPCVGFFWQHGFKGRRAILSNKWGFAFSLTF